MSLISGCMASLPQW